MTRKALLASQYLGTFRRILIRYSGISIHKFATLAKYNSNSLKMMIKQLAFFLALAGSASAMELTPDNYAAETDGKTVFLKFFAPW